MSAVRITRSFTPGIFRTGNAANLREAARVITPADLADVPLFRAMPHALRARIAARSADVRANAGEWITYEGDVAYFWTMLEGEVERVTTATGKEEQLTTFDPMEYFGEVPLVLGTDSFSSIRALKPSRLMRTDASDFHAFLTESPEAAAMIAATLSRRVSFINEAYQSRPTTQATIVGDRLDFACHDIREFLSRNEVPFEWLDPTNDTDCEIIPEQARHADAYPVVLLNDGGTMLTTPSNRDLAQALRLQTTPHEGRYDCVLVGGGPAGLAAAVYGGSEGLRSIMVESEAPGGQAGTSSRIENYLGFPVGVSGGELARRGLQQAKRFDSEILVTRKVERIDARGDGFTIALDGGDVIDSHTVVLATGVSWRELPADGAAELIGRGVFYGATRTEATGVRGKDVYLVGGGNSAGQAAMFFSNYAKSVTILIRADGLEKSMSQYLITQLKTKANIRVETRTTVTKVSGSAHLETITTRVEPSDETQEREASALFVFIGADAETAWLPQELERDKLGYIRTGRDIESWDAERQPFPLETSIPGMFAAGDVRSNSVKRVASAVGEGSMVVAYIHQFLDVPTE